MWFPTISIYWQFFEADDSWIFHWGKCKFQINAWQWEFLPYTGSRNDCFSNREVVVRAEQLEQRGRGNIPHPCPDIPPTVRFPLLCFDDVFSVAEAVITAARRGKKFPLPSIDLEFTFSRMKNLRNFDLKNLSIFYNCWKPDFVRNRSETFSFKRPHTANSPLDFQTFLGPWRVGVSVSNSLKDTHSIIMGSGTMIRAVVISFFAWQKHLLKWKKKIVKWQKSRC